MATMLTTRDGRRQISLRLAPELVAAIDARRDGLSRDDWIAKAVAYCLEQRKIDPPTKETA